MIVYRVTTPEVSRGEKLQMKRPRDSLEIDSYQLISRARGGSKIWHILLTLERLWINVLSRKCDFFLPHNLENKKYINRTHFHPEDEY